VSDAPTVAVVLVTYYDTRYLERLYATIEAQRYPRHRRRLIVVENGPGRAAARWFAEHAPDAEVIVPGDNTGYAGGNALGMQRALEEGAAYVAIVTQDTYLEPDWLRALVDVAQSRPRAGAVQPKIMRRDETGAAVIHTRGNELHFLGVGFVGGDGEPDRELEVTSICYASGAGVLYRSAALREVGVFDPALFMYHEDSDLSWRMRLAGWDVVLAPQAVMHHDYDFSRSARKFHYVERNRLVNVVTHYHAGTLALLAPALLLFEPVTLAYALKSGWLRERLGVYAFFLRPRTWRYLAAKRRAVQRLRRVPDRALAPLLTARFNFGPLATAPVRRIVDPFFAAYWSIARRLITW
jgi:GT2 family glycosyltransferase